MNRKQSAAQRIINVWICFQIHKKRRIVGRVRCKNIKTECPKPTCLDPILLPGRCCKVCPGQDDSKHRDLCSEFIAHLAPLHSFHLWLELKYKQQHIDVLSTIEIFFGNKCANVMWFYDLFFSFAKLPSWNMWRPSKRGLDIYGRHFFPSKCQNEIYKGIKLLES